MTLDDLYQMGDNYSEKLVESLAHPETFVQLGLVGAATLLALLLARQIRKQVPALGRTAGEGGPVWHRYAGRFGVLLFPLFAILFLRIAVEASRGLSGQDWLVFAGLVVAALFLLNTIVDHFVYSPVASRWIKWFGMPIVIFHYLGVLADLVRVLESISLSIGNIELSAYGVIRVIVFGTLLVWIALVLARTGREIIARQKNLDPRTREVGMKLYQVGVFFVVFLVILQIMGINLTALAVFGGALGVGLGFGLQSIAANFISGIIILLDRSVTVGDYVEMNDEKAGYVREMNMRSTTLETFDGKDIMVPNEKFIVEPFSNWTRKDKHQRYRVDFSVAYGTDVHGLVDIVKQTVASHPQVLSGEQYPVELRPDCEIDSFGDSAINMFVEFWMDEIDDGRNRVGGDLLLMIYDALREHGFQIPFPQREVRIVNEGFSFGPLSRQDPD